LISGAAVAIRDKEVVGVFVRFRAPLLQEDVITGVITGEPFESSSEMQGHGAKPL
jgi:hypothetical protein